jgi:ABC-2 type transport system permease protein
MGTFNYVQNMVSCKVNGIAYGRSIRCSCVISFYRRSSRFTVLIYGGWNMLITIGIPHSLRLSRSNIYFLAKWLVGALLVLLTQIWVGVLFVICGKSGRPERRCTGGIDRVVSLRCVGRLCDLRVTTVLSLVIRSFAVPVGIAMIGGIVGLAALAKGYGVLVPLCVDQRRDASQ